jgi:CheY-like chemotaxis protein
MGASPLPVEARRILVIDDSPLMLSAARFGLGEVAGWDVATASSGQSGIELAQSYHPDAILLDVMMPGLDGIDTLAALRGEFSTRGTPVVFLTASEDDRGRLVELGAEGVIGKPFQPAKLAGHLREVLGWSD